MADTQKPEWLTNAENKDKTGTTPQSQVNQSSALNTNANTVTTNNSVGDYNTMANKLANAQKQAQISQLQNAYNNTLNQIAANETSVKDTAQTNRNNASVQSQLAAQQLANRMASLGLQNSGTNAQAMMNNTGALQNTLSSITNSEQQALQDLQNQRTLTYNNLQNDISSANANADISALQNQLSYLNTMNQLKAQQDYATQQALQQREWNLADMQQQRDWQLEDNKNNSLAYTDPATGQTYYINPETAAQLNYNKWALQQQLANRSYGTSSGSSSSSKSSNGKTITSSADDGTIKYSSLTTAQQLAKRKEYNAFLEKNPDSKVSYEDWLYDSYNISTNDNDYYNVLKTDIKNGQITYNDLISKANTIKPYFDEDEWYSLKGEAYSKQFPNGNNPYKK